MINGQFSEMMK